MKTSIIIPTFNRQALLKKCINSWLNQSSDKKNYEIIVVDNNSSDKTQEMVSEYFKEYKNIKYVKEIRKGLVYGRHKGLELAKNEILIFADDDAIYNDKCIEEIEKVYKLNPITVAVGGKIDIQWDKNPQKWVFDYENLLGKLNYGNEIIFSNNIYINGGLFSIKKTILLELGGFNPDQIGDYLIGDGESGLCKKIHKKGLIIGWTPFAMMQHLQFVNKNGTKKDIKRRYYNNGISESYGLFRENNFKLNYKLCRNFLNKSKIYLKLFINKTLNKSDLNNFFKKSNLKGQLYFYILFLNKKFRNELIKDNWF